MASRGASYLVVPASSSWWFDHYVGFRDYLATDHRFMEAGSEALTVVDLRPRVEAVMPG